MTKLHYDITKQALSFCTSITMSYIEVCKGNVCIIMLQCILAPHLLVSSAIASGYTSFLTSISSPRSVSKAPKEKCSCHLLWYGRHFLMFPEKDRWNMLWHPYPMSNIWKGPPCGLFLIISLQGCSLLLELSCAHCPMLLPLTEWSFFGMHPSVGQNNVFAYKLGVIGSAWSWYFEYF